MNTGVMVLRPNRTYHRWLLDEAANDAARPRARYFAEQGFFHERGVPWKHLPGGYNLQSNLVSRRYRLRTADPVTLDTDFFMHKKFFEVWGQS